jgi:hypothetical protein
MPQAQGALLHADEHKDLKFIQRERSQSRHFARLRAGDADMHRIAHPLASPHDFRYPYFDVWFEDL